MKNMESERDTRPKIRTVVDARNEILWLISSMGSGYVPYDNGSFYKMVLLPTLPMLLKDG
uniref:Uncharacterized protein n=1 Tax=Lepeophtheirus salmonis TaxID=72036 RepID=A0A0K2U3E8_LEPSM